MPEVCLDGWTITYTEFQPQKRKRIKKQPCEEALTRENTQNQPVISIPITQSIPVQKDQRQDNTIEKANNRECYHCHVEGHTERRCPKKYPRMYGHNKLKWSHKTGRLDNMDWSDARKAKKVVFGPILVNLNPTTVLFDRSSTHSFISITHVATQKLSMSQMPKTMLVNTPRREIRATHMCPKVNLHIQNASFEVDLIVLESLEIDVVLGMGWVSTCHGVIDPIQRTVSLTTSSGERIVYEGTQICSEQSEDATIELDQ